MGTTSITGGIPTETYVVVGDERKTFSEMYHDWGIQFVFFKHLWVSKKQIQFYVSLGNDLRF